MSKDNEWHFTGLTSRSMEEFLKGVIRASRDEQIFNERTTYPKALSAPRGVKGEMGTPDLGMAQGLMMPSETPVPLPSVLYCKPIWGRVANEEPQIDFVRNVGWVNWTLQTDDVYNPWDNSVRVADPSRLDIYPGDGEALHLVRRKSKSPIKGGEGHLDGILLSQPQKFDTFTLWGIIGHDEGGVQSTKRPFGFTSYFRV